MVGRSVLIVGAGIAGPALAFWLLRYGFEPTLVEQAPKPRTEGYVIDFWGLGYDLVEQMGLLPQVLAAGYAMREVRLVNERGRRVGGFNADVFRSATDQRFISLPRSELSGILLRAVSDHVPVHWGRMPVAIEQRSDGVMVCFNDGRTERFDCVIGADGLHSVVRHQIFGDSSNFERYLGFRVAAFQAAGYRHRDELVYLSFTAPGRQLARMSLPDDRTLFFFMASEPEPDPAPCEHRQVMQYLDGRFGDMGWEAADVLSAADTVRDIYIDRVSQIRMRRWWRGHVALVGDAAYAPSLLAGQGSALAIIGAYVLAGELSRSVAPEGAFERYQERLQRFITDKQDAAIRLAGGFAPETSLGVWLRNLVTRAMALPAVAKLAMGKSLRDDITLPIYTDAPRAASVSRSPPSIVEPSA